MVLSVKIWQENLVGVIEKETESELRLNRNWTTQMLNQGYPSYSMRSYVIDDVFFVCCEIQHEEPVSRFYESGFDDDKEELTIRSEFGEQMFALRSAGYFDSTVIIQSEGKEFKANKLNLMACSEVFSRMFSHTNSIEAKTEIMKIEDTKPEVIDALIRWIYQVGIENMEEIGMELYKVADKYAIGPLKNKCVKIMAKSLSKDNLMPRLVLAYKFSEEKLKQHVLNFLREDNKSLTVLMASDQWFDFRVEDPKKAKEILADIFD